MTARIEDGSNAQITEALKRQVEAFKNRLIDFSRNNRLLFYRDLKIGTLRLPPLESPSMQRLLSNSSCKLAELVDSTDETSTTRAKAREIRLKAKANEEERGLKTLFAAVGFASWSMDDGGRDVQAPLFLLPIDIAEANRPGLDPTMQRAGDLQPNYALISFVREQYGIEVDGDQLQIDNEDDIGRALTLFGGMLSSLPKFMVRPDCVLGNFDFQKMAMVKDLDENLDLIATNELVAAITGDSIARAAIADAQLERVSPSELDSIPARDELFVLDADSSQQAVLHTMLRNGSHGVVQGPPGTGKSQTISNLIASLIGDGKRVLFVAEKRAALDAVMKRLNRVGLSHLVLDLHGADVKRKTIYDNLRAADQIARSTPPADGVATYERFEELRRKLNDYCAAVNMPRPQCGSSFYELQGRLAAIVPEAQSELVLSKSVMERLNGEESRRVSEIIDRAAANSALFLRDPNTPWACCELRDEASVTTATDTVEKVCQALPQLLDTIRHFTNGTSIIDMASTTDLEAFASVLQTASEVVATYSPSITLPEAEMAVRDMSAGQANFFTRLFAFCRSDHRRGVKTLRTHAKAHADAQTLYLAACKLIGLLESWRTPIVLERLSKNRGSLEANLIRLLQDMKTLKAMAGVHEPDALDAYAGYVNSLRRARLSAHRIPQVRSIESELRQIGLEPFLRELTRNPRSPELWKDSFEAVWVRSHIELLLIDDARLATFDRRTHEETIREFQELDRKRLGLAAARVKRRAAELYFAAKKEHTNEDVTFQTQLNRKIKQLPLRKLMSVAPHMATSLCPCWMASPLSVSQLISPQANFDVIIFDEASQVLPEDAITSIIRGKRTIVAGDRHQLPPTTFFSASDIDDDDDNVDDAAAGIESILDLMSIFVSPQSLEWHYRSKDERLIAFSNEHFYKNLITFPGVGQPPPAIQHISVQPILVDGEELSSSAEVQKVVQLILENAASRPQESLGVIAMGIKHARRIDAALYEARKAHPELDDFFADRGEESFFCKNLERVQGDERDVIFLSTGYGKDHTGKMYYRFGPLGVTGGERRLNVAITRSRLRVVTISTFGSADMDEKRLNAMGPRLLKGYLRFAETSGRDLGRDGAVDEYEPNPFENDVQAALEARGLSIVPQYGVSSYRIDLAVQNPDHPGSYVLAIECDGATYHSAETARDRDRIRQMHLEALGWRFHRVWSTDWFNDRSKEIDRAVEAYRVALSGKSVTERNTDQEISAASSEQPSRSPNRPAFWPGNPIEYYRREQLREVVKWIASDGLLRTDDELVREAMKELGFQRLGPKIERHLRQAVTDARAR